MKNISNSLATQMLFAFTVTLVPLDFFAVESYNPLSIDSSAAIVLHDVTVHDATRERDIPVRIYLPKGTTPAPVILFSHGLGGSREGSQFLGEHWAARGYVAVFMQHPGSDEGVWRNEPLATRMSALERSASLKNFVSRVKDVPAVLTQLGAWNTSQTNFLHARLDLTKVGMSGHSFGAVTTEAVSGEVFPLRGQEFTDPRIKASIAFSPSPSRSLSQDKAFGFVKIPWMLMTGTRDNSPIGNVDAKARRSVFPALHGAPKYELVLNDAEHSVFTDGPLPGEKNKRNPNHHRVILALSTAFWDAYLQGDSRALAWLNSNAPRSFMESGDIWQFEE